MNLQQREHALRQEIGIYERDYELYTRVLKKDVDEAQELDLIEQIEIIDDKLTGLYAELFVITNLKTN